MKTLPQREGGHTEVTYILMVLVLAKPNPQQVVLSKSNNKKLW